MVARLLTMLIIAGLFASPSALAQENESGMTRLLKDAGIEMQAVGTREFELQGQSLTNPLLYYFAGITFNSVEDAQTAMQIVPPGLQAAFSDSPSDEWVNVSAGDLGEERAASTYVNHAVVGEPIIGVLMARVGTVIVIGVTGGISISPIELLVPYIESSLDAFAGADPQTEEEITALLPSLSDMPPGYAEAADDATGPGSATPAPTLTSTPAQTNESPTEPALVFDFEGTGNFGRDDIALEMGGYYIGLTCASEYGKATLQIGEGGKVGRVTTSGPTSEQTARTPDVETRRDDVRLAIECDGAWEFKIWKFK